MTSAEIEKENVCWKGVLILSYSGKKFIYLSQIEMFYQVIIQLPFCFRQL